MDGIKFEVPNDINVVISSKDKGVLLDDDCCTVINIMLTNEGKIATSFLGTHNPFIVSQLERAQKEYFKVLKKTLKKDYKEYAEAPGFGDDDECDCGCGIKKEDVAFDDSCDCGCHHEHEHHHCDCGCETHEDCSCDETCDCHTHEKTCDCDETCDCGCNEGKPCTCEGSCKEDSKKENTKKSKSCKNKKSGEKKSCKKNK